MSGEEWARAIAALDYAFQPIVSIYSGVCLGYEALLRGWEAGGFASIQELFDAAFDEQNLFHLELALREKAVRKFTEIHYHKKVKLFFNIDNRVLLMPDYSTSDTARILARCGLSPDTVVFELSEKHDLGSDAAITDASLASYRRQAYKIAIDDFGTGYSGLQLLYSSEPDFIKIDRFFIAGMGADSKKRLFVGKVLNLAHTLGIMVIAEGVETESEYSCCKDIGCDYIQGFLVQKPTTDIRELMEKHERISRLNTCDRRDKSLDHVLLNQEMEYLEPIHLHTPDTGYLTDMATVFDSFRKYKSYSFFPVTNGNDAPIGIIKESEIKEYVYSKYGKDLLLNKAAGRTLLDFVVKCPIADVNTRIENIIECFAIDGVAEGVLLTVNGRYAGFLSAKSLLRVVNEKNIAVARDQNPLTRLPGNTVIGEFLEHALEDRFSASVVAYLDIDHFKAFNDVYGFRQGDRAILLFADILKEAASRNGFFIGHIGGDDFFVGCKVNGFDILQVLLWIRGIVEKFSFDVLSLYDPDHRRQGFITSVDRDGRPKSFPLLSASGAVLHIPDATRTCTTEQVGAMIARLKMNAKSTPEKIAVATLGAGSPSSVLPFPESFPGKRMTVS
jgi:EAL domain-containing protein (putative c-di-GMP-specific phosphodiesterase class I)/GGDEF domain-containing protein